MLKRNEVDEAKKLLDLDDALRIAILRVEKKVWMDNRPFNHDEAGSLFWDGAELLNISVPKEDMLAYLNSRKAKAVARLRELGVEA